MSAVAASRVSIVVPVMNEVDTIAALAEQVLAASDASKGFVLAEI